MDGCTANIDITAGTPTGYRGGGFIGYWTARATRSSDPLINASITASKLNSLTSSLTTLLPRLNCLIGSYGTSWTDTVGTRGLTQISDCSLFDTANNGGTSVGILSAEVAAGLSYYFLSTNNATGTYVPQVILQNIQCIGGTAPALNIGYSDLSTTHDPLWNPTAKVSGLLFSSTYTTFAPTMLINAFSPSSYEFKEVALKGNSNVHCNIGSTLNLVATDNIGCSYELTMTDTEVATISSNTNNKLATDFIQATTLDVGQSYLTVGSNVVADYGTAPFSDFVVIPATSHGDRINGIISANTISSTVTLLTGGTNMKIDAALAGGTSYPLNKV